MTTIDLVLGAIVLLSASGLAAAALARRPAAAQVASCALLCAGAALGIAAAAVVLLGGEAAASARFALRLDALSALFLVPICLIAGAGAVYGIRYFPQAGHGLQAVRLQIFYGLAAGGMALLVVASNAIVFLVGWEVMALANFFLVLTEHDRREVQRAAFLYLASTHVGTLALFALFAVLRAAAGSFDFAAMEGLRAGGQLGTRVFLLVLLGFGLKAGLMPLHFWLPPAHAAAPSHVSALMSGVVVKTGIYGILRVTGFFDAPPAAWGVTLLVLGGVSAVLGVAFALAQHDLKRLLAYHTVENIGIIALGAGLALLGRARGEPALVLLGFAGGALHVVNHAIFKSLLFLGAGAVQHATGTREIDRLGGLARPLPATTLLFAVGAAAISGLPPLNGFVSEWLVYLGFLDVLGRPAGDLLAFAATGAPVLALVGGLAAACFAKVVGVVFLGSPRSAHVAGAHEAPAAMLAPMAVLAAACLAIGLAPAAVLPPLARAAAAWSRLDHGVLLAPARSAAASASLVSAIALALLLVAAGAWLLRRRRLAAVPEAAEVETWSCGFAAPTARIQYTGSSFAELLLRRFSWAVRLRAEAPRLLGPFPARAAFHSEVPDPVLDGGLVPVARAYLWLAARAPLLYLQRLIQFQMLLVLATLVAVLALPPLVLGLVNRTKAIVAGRKGPPLLQAYFDLAKLLRKGAVYSRTTSWVFRAGPVVGLAAVASAGLLLAMGGAPALVSFGGDFVLFAYLLGLARFVTALAALDTGSPFEGMGAAREVTFASLAEPALFLCLLVLARATGFLSLSGMLGPALPAAWAHAAPALVLAAIGLFVVALAENARIPVDDPNTHLELTMIHEVMVLDHGGPDLAFILYGASLKLFLFGAIFSRLVLGHSEGALASEALFFAGIALFAVGVGVVESVMARLRMVRVPQLLVGASVLSAFALVLLLR